MLNLLGLASAMRISILHIEPAYYNQSYSWNFYTFEIEVINNLFERYTNGNNFKAMFNLKILNDSTCLHISSPYYKYLKSVTVSKKYLPSVWLHNTQFS